jgi:phosphoglycolate phosphatase-like HAD superfamily hydrolase
LGCNLIEFMRSLLITDLDNTLYNWIDYYAPCFRGMVHVLSREMKIEEAELKLAFKSIFQEAGTLEYSFTIQNLPFIKNYTKPEVDKFVDLGKKVFKIVRDKNLIPYDSIKSTLEYLTNQGIIIIAVTNAPVYFAESRLKQLNLDKYFYGIAGWEGNEVPLDNYTNSIIEKSQQGKYNSQYIKKRWKFNKNEIKPNPFAYLTVMDYLKVSHKCTYIVGDSIGKDLLPANEIGAVSIWAKYGIECKKKNLDTIIEITHWDEKAINVAYEKKEITPDYTIESFLELREIVKGPQLQLF